MSCRDFEEVPKVTPTWILDWISYSILALQMPTLSAAYLQGLNLMVFLMCEAHTWLNINGCFFAAGVRGTVRVLGFDIALPLAANLACELYHRRVFSSMSRIHDA